MKNKSSERALIYSAKYHSENRDRILEEMRVRNKAYYILNKEKIKAQALAYQKANGAARNAYKSKWNSEKTKSSPEFAMLMTMRKFVSRMIDRVNSKRIQRTKTTEMLGYTPADFVSHIQPMFKSGMNWENHGMWHIDHIRPLSSFDLSDQKQRLMANSLHNLQPMWASQNMKKSDSWSGQASLI